MTDELTTSIARLTTDVSTVISDVAQALRDAADTTDDTNAAAAINEQAQKLEDFDATLKAPPAPPVGGTGDDTVSA